MPLSCVGAQSINMRDAARYRGALTKRERQVAVLTCDGLSNKTIAHKLCVTEGTVKHHLHSIYQKLGVPNKAGLIIAFSDRIGS